MFFKLFSYRLPCLTSAITQEELLHRNRIHKVKVIILGGYNVFG